MKTPPAHRGRFQAQGGGIEESEAWAQSLPLPASDAYNLLKRLKGKLTGAEFGMRERAFEKAEQYVHEASRNGGIRGLMKASFPQPPRSDQRRVDIEVSKGLAFVATEKSK